MKWKHLKSGGTYNVLTHTAMLQCSTHPEVEKLAQNWTVYERDGLLFVRMTSEFLDGRFVPAPDNSQTQEKGLTDV